MVTKIQHINLSDSKLSEELPKGFKPSPTMMVRFRGGQIVAMNRRERRRHHIISKVERQPNPPAIFHSKEEREVEL